MAKSKKLKEGEKLKNINKILIMSLFVVLMSTSVFSIQYTIANITRPVYGSTEKWYNPYISVQTQANSYCYYQIFWRDVQTDPSTMHYGFTMPLFPIDNTNRTVQYGNADFTMIKYKPLYGIYVMCNGQLGKFHLFHIDDGTTAPIITPMCDMTQAECDQQIEDLSGLNSQVEMLNNNVMQLESDLAEKETELSTMQSSITDLNSQILNLEPLIGELGECRESVITKDQEISSLTSEIEGMSMLKEFASYMTLAQKRTFLCEYMKYNNLKNLEQYNVRCDSTYSQKANGRWTGSCKCKAIV